MWAMHITAEYVSSVVMKKFSKHLDSSEAESIASFVSTTNSALERLQTRVDESSPSCDIPFCGDGTA
jgi:hypothetical protein